MILVLNTAVIALCTFMILRILYETGRHEK